MKKKNNTSLFKKVNAFLHLWLGLISGLVVFIVSITGCLFSFQKEISDVVYRKEFFITPQASGKTLPITRLKQIADHSLGIPSNFITTYQKDKTHTWEFMCYKPGDQKSFFWFGTIDSYKSVFINPYSGKITGVMDYKNNFFVIVKSIHWSLLLNDKYGQPIVGYSTLIFVILLISGLILWWPKNLKKANFDKSFKIKWKAGFKRLNYDLHNVPGFYALFIGIILGLTGMVFAMKWFETSVYILTNQSLKPPVFKSINSDTTQKALNNPLDIAFFTAKRSMPEAQRIGLSPATGTKGAIYILGYRGKEIYYDYDQLQFDQYTGKLLNRQNFRDKNSGEKIIGMNYDIHVGAILGLPGKILAFLASLICASLPVTGFIIWLGKKKKSKQKVRRSLQHLKSFKKRNIVLNR
ncbi:PepSY-associated TM helix domain-containing protein [Mucilaginibacter arboris]|uniref:PepSY domain-containing protein n=1 Tax=Mucilaginibacter arboris TaxID=2682090 RepID=A0A7K1T018_9SPHI|nr:PepSY-associated TM helix domain-containing protein [Mucilaginibacter arboris]MVN22911.1 PepSY domain-containing protein [Mucilaginibacter arboris]